MSEGETWASKSSLSHTKHRVLDRSIAALFQRATLYASLAICKHFSLSDKYWFDFHPVHVARVCVTTGTNDCGHPAAIASRVKWTPKKLVTFDLFRIISHEIPINSIFTKFTLVLSRQTPKAINYQFMVNTRSNKFRNSYSNFCMENRTILVSTRNFLCWS